MIRVTIGESVSARDITIIAAQAIIDDLDFIFYNVDACRVLSISRVVAFSLGHFITVVAKGGRLAGLIAANCD